MTGKIGKFVALCIAALVTSAGVAAATGVHLGAAPKKKTAATTRLCLNLKKGTLRQLALKSKSCRKGERIVVLSNGPSTTKSAAGLQARRAPARTVLRANGVGAPTVERLERLQRRG